MISRTSMEIAAMAKLKIITNNAVLQMKEKMDYVHIAQFLLMFACSYL